MMLFLLALSVWLAITAQASFLPYHESVPSARVVYDDYGPSYSLAANPIVVPDLPARAVIGPSEGPVVIQGPYQGPSSVVGPSEGPVLIQGPQQSGAAVIGPSSGAATIVGPSEGAVLVQGPSDGQPAKIISSSNGGAAIIGPSVGRATIIGPSSSGGAAIIGPSGAGVQHVIRGEDAHAHAEAHARAEAHAHALSHNLIALPPRQTVYVKEVIREPVIHHVHEPHDHRVVCEPTDNSISTSAAIEAVARAASHHGPVHVGSAHGRPVITLSGPPVIGLKRPLYLGGPYVPIHAGASSSSSSSSSASSSSSSSASNYQVGKKTWYPSPSWIDC